MNAARWLESPERLSELLHEAAVEDAPDHISGDESRDRLRERLTDAAVLLGLVRRESGITLLLTRRTSHLKDHAGQISFPGGRMEPEDANAAACALREAQEEIGLDPSKVQVVGGLRSYDTVTGYRVHPVVGWIEPPVRFTIDPFEVDELFEVPLGFLLEERNLRRDSLTRDGRRRYFWAIPYGDHYIWGATAGMLVNFLRLLRSHSGDSSSE